MGVVVAASTGTPPDAPVDNRITAEDVFPSFSQIDPAVRSAVPEHLLELYRSERHEFMGAAGQHSEAAPAPAPAPAHSAASAAAPPSAPPARRVYIDEAVLAALPPEVRLVAEQLAERERAVLGGGSGGGMPNRLKLKRARQVRLSQWGFKAHHSPARRGGGQQASRASAAAAKAAAVAAAAAAAAQAKLWQGFAQEPFADIRSAVMRWCRRVDRPSARHTQLLMCYVDWLQAAEQLDTLRALHRLLRAVGTSFPAWSHVAATVQTAIQDVCVRNFGFSVAP